MTDKLNETDLEIIRENLIIISGTLETGMSSHSIENAKKFLEQLWGVISELYPDNRK